MRRRNWLAGSALALILAGQLAYLPKRLDFWQELARFARAAGVEERARLAWGARTHDLLQWIEANTPERSTLLLVTARPERAGLVYHRALYQLYPRTVWWAAPRPADRYPAWWQPIGAGEAAWRSAVLRLGATAVLAEGFASPPLAEPWCAFDAETRLIFPEERR